MDTVLQGYKGVVYFLDSILITGATREEQIQNLKNVLCRLQKFGQIFSNYLGHALQLGWLFFKSN